MQSARATRDADVIVVGAGPGGLGHRLPPGPGRARRAAAGEDRVPAREGLRRRPDPARGEVAGLRWASTPAPTAGWLHNKGLRIIGGGMRLRDPLARARRATRRTAWSDPRSDFDELLARHGGQGRRAPARADDRHRPGARRAHRPHRRRHRQAATARRRSPTARRWWSPPTATPAGSSLAMGLQQARRPPDGRRGPHLLHEPAARRRLARVLAGALGQRRRRPASGCCPATAGSSASATAPATSASASSTPARPGARSTTRTCCKRWLDQTPGGVGLPRGEPHRAGARRGAADGLQPAAALRPRPAARRRLRRHGQPVQRRGHRLRDGVRRAGRRGHRAGAGPADGRRARAGAAGLPADAEAGVRRLLHARPGVREGHRRRPR